MKTRGFIRTIAVTLSLLLALLSVPCFGFSTAFAAPPEDETAATADSTVTRPTREPIEIIGLRGENEKHYLMPDGTMVAAQYGEAVHRRDAAGVWQDIDNRLTAVSDGYETGDARVKFTKETNGSGRLFTLHDGSYKITLSLEGGAKKVPAEVSGAAGEVTGDKLTRMTALANLHATVRYNGVLEGVDLEYLLRGNAIKENIVIHSPDAAESFSFALSLNNLSAEMVCGTVLLCDKRTGEARYRIPGFYMYDAAGVYSDAVAATLSDEGNGSYRLTLTPDAAWMNDPGRVYPVTVDPTVSQDGYDSSPYTGVDAATPNQNCRGWGSQSLAPGKYAYYKWSDLPTLPACSTVTEARLMVPHSFTTDTDISVAVYRVESGWNASTLTYAATVAETDPAGKRAEVYSDVQTTQLNSSNFYFYITDPVRRWYEDPTQNYGVAFALADKSAAGKTLSLDFYDNYNECAMPRIFLTYTSHSGYEDYYSYTMQSAGSAGVGYVDNYSGNLLLMRGTVASTDALFGYEPMLCYDGSIAGTLASKDRRGSVTGLPAYGGYGFRVSFLEFMYISMGNMVYLDGDGTEHYFERESSGSSTYLDCDGLHLTAERATESITLTDASHTVRYFVRSADRGYYQLSRITDQSGNILHFIQDNSTTLRICLQPAGSSLQIEQLRVTLTSSGRLSQISHPSSGERVEFYYSESPSGTDEPTAATGYLRRILYRKGTVECSRTEYVYNTSGKLIRATDTTNLVHATYSYNSAGRVATSGSYSTSGDEGGLYGATTYFAQQSYTYAADHTCVRDSGSNGTLESASASSTDDLVSHYNFDRTGKVTSSYVTDPSGTTLHGAGNISYADDNPDAVNSVRSVADVSNALPNLLDDGTFSINNDSGGLAYWETSGKVDIYTWKSGVTLNTQDDIQESCVSQQRYLEAGDYTMRIWYDVNNLDSCLDFGVLSVATYSSAPYYMMCSDDTYATLHFTVATSGVYTVYIKLYTWIDYSWDSMTVNAAMLTRSTGSDHIGLISAGDFESRGSTGSARISSFWTAGTDTTYSVTSAPGEALFGQSLVLPGAGTQEKVLSQPFYTAIDTFIEDFELYGKNEQKDRTYTISGWAKGTGQTCNPDQIFALRVRISYIDRTYENGTTTVSYRDETVLLPFSPNITDWQFVSGTIRISRNDAFVKSIQVELVYGEQPGTAYFDDITVTRDDTATTYLYGGDEDATYEYLDPTTLAIPAGYAFAALTGTVRTEYGYDTNRNLRYRCNSVGDYESYTYDSANRLLSSARGYRSWYGDGTVSLRESTAFTYNAYGQLTQTVTVTDSQAYTAAAETLTQITTSATYLTTLSATNYLFGAVTSETDATGNTVYYNYCDDQSGRIEAIQDCVEESTGTAYVYDDRGRPIRVAVAYFENATDAEDYWINGDDQGLDVPYADSSYTYRGQLASLTTPSTAYHFTYNVYGQMIESKAGSSTLASYSYDAGSGNLRQLSYSNGFGIKYAYDTLGRLTQVSYNTGTDGAYQTVCSYSYDADGRVERIEDQLVGSQTEYEYNGQGQPSGKMVFSGGYVLYSEETSYYEYSSYPEESTINLQSIGKPRTVSQGIFCFLDGSYYRFAEYNYNLQGCVSSCTTTGNAGNGAESYTYYVNGLLKSSSQVFTSMDSLNTTLHSQSTSYTYRTVNGNTTGQVETRTSTVGGTTVTEQYAYDSRGNITEIRQNNVLQYQYSYDQFNRLVMEANRPLGTTTIWTYDDAGNILSRKVYSFTTDYPSSSTLQATYTYSYGNSNWGDLLTSWSGESITYDAIGNPTSYRGKALTWQGRRLMSIDNVTYTYDVDGNLLTRNVKNGTITTEHAEFFISGGKIVGETGTSGLRALYFYDASGTPVSMYFNSTRYYYATNLQGDIIALYAEGGTKICDYYYNAYGACTISYSSSATTAQRAAASFNPLRYRGYYYDTETGLYYISGRYYDPETGRWLGSDVGSLSSYGGDARNCNSFAYCGNNPVNYRANSVVLGNRPVFAAKSVTVELPSPEIHLGDQCIYYDVPLYNQYDTPLCWAFCQVMIEDFYAGICRTNKKAMQRAKELATERLGPDSSAWVTGSWPTNSRDVNGEPGIDDIYDLYHLLCTEGPVYALYDGEDGAHLIVVTGVNLTRGIVYTNNPWGIAGEQTYEEFLGGFAGQPRSWHMPFKHFIVPVK